MRWLSITQLKIISVLAFSFILGLLSLIAIRLLWMISKVTNGAPSKPHYRTKPAKTVICIGSGGHTTEMLHLTRTLDASKFTPRIYLIADSDTTSAAKVRDAERSNPDYKLLYVPRSRKVGQSYTTSVFTTLYSIIRTVPLVVRTRPDLLLCNGPGTCIPVCLIAFALKSLFVCDTRIVFVESFCRTRTFSLTGKILMGVADNILVQWPALKTKLRRVDYIGQLMWNIWISV